MFYMEILEHLILTINQFFEEMMRLMPNTLILSVMSLSLIIVLGLIGGIFLAWFQDRFFGLDRKNCPGLF